MTKAYRGRGPCRAGGDGLGSILGYGVGGTLLRDEDTGLTLPSLTARGAASTPGNRGRLRYWGPLT